jgi:hypothetical protein
MIKLDEVGPGDQVTLQDSNGNVAVGVVGSDGRSMWIEAFGQRIDFCHRAPAKGPNGKQWQGVRGVSTVGHIPAML